MPASNTIIFLIIGGNPPSPYARSSVTEWLMHATGASWQKSSALGRLPTYNETHSRSHRGGFFTKSPAIPAPRQTSMSVLSILEFPDPRLRTRAEPVSVFDARLEQLVADMF